VEKLLDFTVDYFEGIRVFTNVEYIKEKYINSCFEFVEEYEKSDICIVDSNYILKDDSKFKINIDKYDSHANAFISNHHITDYLDLLEKFNPNVCGIGMADIEDVKLSTKGILTEHIIFKITSDDELENIAEFKKNLKGGNFKGSAILFLSVKDYSKLNRYGEVLVKLYGNIDIVLFTPSKKEETEEKYVEIFIFKGVEDNE